MAILNIKKITLVIASSMALLGLNSCGKELSETDIYNEAYSKVYKIHAQGADYSISQGSGFYIGDDTFVTNYHVLENTYSATISQSNTPINISKFVIESIYSGNGVNSDYCITKTNYKGSRGFSFENNYKVGETVYACGFPNDALRVVVTKGEILGTTTSNSKNYIVNTAKITNGSSGGVLLNSKGKVLGITTGELEDGKYVAIPYKDFSAAIKNKGKSPVEYLHFFHKSFDTHISEFNFQVYFDIKYKKENVYSNGASIRYTVFLEPKKQYIGRMRSDKSVAISFKVETMFTIVDKRSGTSKTETKTDTESTYLNEKNSYSGTVVLKVSATDPFDSNRTYSSSETLKIFTCAGALTIFI